MKVRELPMSVFDRLEINKINVNLYSTTEIFFFFFLRIKFFFEDPF